MRIDLHVYHHTPQAPPELAEILSVLAQIQGKFAPMSAELDTLTAAVTAEDTVIDSALTLINGFAAQLAAAVAANADGPALQAIADDITAKSAALATAVAANTPAAPAP